MKRIKLVKLIFLLIIISGNSFANGEISFRKQKEKVLREQQEQRENEKEATKTAVKKTTVSRERNIRQAILDTAYTQMGVPYVYGANGNGAYDCSSYVQFVYKKALNVNLPRVSYQQAEAGKKVPVSQLKAGDLVVFDTLGKNRISHVGIYIGNNQFVHASSGYKKVVISQLEGFYAEKFRFGVKII